MKKERKVIDAHLHIFGHCEFGDRLAHGIGDEPTQEYLTEKYYGRLGIEKGIVMGNGPLEEQGKNLGEYFYYSAGLDEKDSWLKLEEIESHLQRKRCVGVKLYPGYYELYVFISERQINTEQAVFWQKFWQKESIIFPVCVRRSRISIHLSRIVSKHWIAELQPCPRNMAIQQEELPDMYVRHRTASRDC